MKYYINGDNRTLNNNIPPYKSEYRGAESFHELFDDMENYLNDGDEIILCGSTYIDDRIPTTDVIINKSFKIYSKNDGIKRMVYTYTPFNITSHNVTLTNVGFLKYDTSNSSSLETIEIYEHVKNCVIDSCSFEVLSDNIVGHDIENRVILLNGCEYSTIKNNTFKMKSKQVLASTTNIYGVVGLGGYSNSIVNNTFLLNDSYSTAIYYSGGTHTNIELNSIFVEDNTDDSKLNNCVGISVAGVDYNMLTIKHNGITIRRASTGISVDGNSGTQSTTMIKNNVVNIEENDNGSTGIFVSTNNYTGILNNIINKSDEGYNDSVALNVTINNGMIDHNCIYGFSAPNRFIHDDTQYNIKELGSKNIYVDPMLYISTKTPQKNISDYMIENLSNCVGSGYLMDNIGVFTGSGLNVVDTIINSAKNVRYYRYGEPYKTPNITNNHMVLFNSVIKDTCAEFNKNIRGVDSSDSGYCSDNIYKNMFGFNIPNSPLYTGGSLYRKPKSYIYDNKSLFVPFNGITCPTNPGYGYSQYIQYPTGIFGYSRYDYVNGCGGTGTACTIQDTFTSNEIIQDVNSGTIIIQDSTNPNC